MTARTTSRLATAGLVALAALVLTACGSSSGSSGAAGTPTTPSTSTATGAAAGSGVATAKTSASSVIVDAHGHTLYLLTSDSTGKSSCSEACAAVWPPATGSLATAAHSAGVTATLGSLTRSDGTTQLTVDGHPAYTFSGDAQAGDAHGLGIASYGGYWYVFAPSGSIVMSAAPTAAATAPSAKSGY